MPFGGLLTVGLIGAGTGAFGSIFGANKQADAAKQAAQLQAQSAANSLDFQKQQFATEQQNLAPWLQAGKGALSTLSGLTSTPGQGLLQGFNQQFQAPTAQQAAATPGYQFQLQQGQNAIQNSAAARGGLVSGNAATGLDQYSQGLASENYGNTYNRAMQEYLNSANIFNTNQTNQYNRLAGLAGTGQNAATMLGQEGQAAAQNVGNINMTAGGQIGQNINNAGAATASGYVGGANAIAGGVNNIGQLGLLSQLGLLNNSGATGWGAGTTSQDYADLNMPGVYS